MKKPPHHRYGGFAFTPDARLTSDADLAAVFALDDHGRGAGTHTAAGTANKHSTKNANTKNNSKN